MKRKRKRKRNLRKDLDSMYGRISRRRLRFRPACSSARVRFVLKKDRFLNRIGRA